MQLKTYQQATLDTLRRFFEAAQAHGPKAAYEAITTEPDQVRRLCGYGGRYTPLLGVIAECLSERTLRPGD